MISSLALCLRKLRLVEVHLVCELRHTLALIFSPGPLHTSACLRNRLHVLDLLGVSRILLEHELCLLHEPQEIVERCPDLRQGICNHLLGANPPENGRHELLDGCYVQKQTRLSWTLADARQIVVQAAAVCDRYHHDGGNVLLVGATWPSWRSKDQWAAKQDLCKNSSDELTSVHALGHGTCFSTQGGPCLASAFVAAPQENVSRRHFATGLVHQASYDDKALLALDLGRVLPRREVFDRLVAIHES